MHNKNELEKQILHSEITVRNVLIAKDGEVKIDGFGIYDILMEKRLRVDIKN